MNPTNSLPEYEPMEHMVSTINLEHLHFPEYAKAVSPKMVKRLVKNFNRHLFDLPVVGLRDNKLYVLDGKTRIEALRQLGYTHVQVRFIQGSGTNASENE